MSEDEVRTVLWVQAIETAPRVGEAPPWSPADAADASAAAAHALGEGADADAFTLARARLVLRRLAERVPTLPAAAPAPGRGGRLLAGAAGLLAMAAGVAADAGWSGGRIQLLALPLLGVLGWNLLVYAALLVGALRGWMRRVVPPAGGQSPALGGGFDTASTGRDLAGWAAGRWLRGVSAGQPRWWRAARLRQAELLRPVLAPVRRQRLFALLHLAAALLALGLLLSLYARGMVLDFRAGWDSTFLEAAQVHALLGWVLAPGSAWPGLALPGVAEIAPLRWADGSPGAPAAPWIHRLALTLVALVVLPRLALAAWAAWRAARLAKRLALPPDDPYLAALRQQAPARPLPVTVLPYNCHDSAARQAGLLAELRRWRGPGARPQCLPVMPLGAEDALPAALPAGLDGDVVVLLSLNATPEREHHGMLLARLPRHLGAGARCTVLLDSRSFDQRLAGQPDAAARRAGRIAAWQALVAEAGLPPARVADLGAPDDAPPPAAPARAQGMAR